MIDKIKSSIDDISSFESKSSEEIELFRIKYLGKKGIINKLFSEFKTIDNSEKKKVGQLLNQLKNAANQKMADLILDISDGSNQSKSINDITRPGDPIAIGSRHPISLVKNRIINILNENNYNAEDCILILRTFLSKAKRILKLAIELEQNQSIEKIKYQN